MGVEITLTAELHSDNLSDGFSREEYFANGVRISKAMLARIKELESHESINVPMSDIAIKKISMATYAVQPVGVLFKTEHDIGVVTNGGAFVWLNDNEFLKSVLGVTA